ncbi:TetR/AcrR family transcriptional regulator [Streptomyces sp. Ru87]|uniref:TetR/AcrR family transcriptional regulator n=1 Tax=Streptomyces sp. Ru87 TaxID=2044307 RepID=UPI000BF79302|nr:TetR/AcrR family transcriptional regulator [Streptomyces sp. Ru87]PGH49897.1 TetR family transcriptional regulator [Streptomyces sp. Ru87]
MTVNTAATALKRTGEPRLRADALRNRERIVAAAREMFVEHGADVSLDEVARRAGVGNATLYRHFADRQELVRRVTLYVTHRITDQAEAALAEEADGYEALRRFVHAVVDERVGALCTMLAGTAEERGEHTEARERLEGAVERIMASARDCGRLRADVEFGDLMVALTQLTRPLPNSGCLNFDRFAHRHLQLFLDGLHTPARSELPGSAVTLEDLRQRP